MNKMFLSFTIFLSILLLFACQSQEEKMTMLGDIESILYLNQMVTVE